MESPNDSSTKESRKVPKRLGFILLMAAMTALDAFSIDSMIPALEQISADLNVTVNNQRQYIITSIFLGFSIGVLIYGFVADRYGRRIPVLAGFSIYTIGSLACIFADSLGVLLLGRIMQGLGAAGPYVLSVTIVRDLYKGRDMAQILSLIMMVFIGIPMIAPFIGQGVLLIAGWRSIFLVLGIYGVCIMVWFWLRQEETLRLENRTKLSGPIILRSIIEVFSNRQTLRYLIAMGAVSGAFIAYLSTAQQIFQNMYELGTTFPAVFAALASLFGIGSFLNARWVHAYGSVKLVHLSLGAIVLTSVIYLVSFPDTEVLPPLWVHLVYLSIVMFFCAFLFGNLTSLALEPMGHIAGSASSLVNSISTVIAIGVATLIGSQLENSIQPVVVGFALAYSIAWILNYARTKIRIRA